MLEADKDETQLLGDLGLWREVRRQRFGGRVDNVGQGGEHALDDQVGHYVQADASHFSQTLARSGASDKNNTDYNGSITENGSEQANKRAYTEGVAEGGRDRLEQKDLVEGGADRLMERNAVAEGGRDRLEQKGLVEDGSSRANKRAYADGVVEGGADRLAELHQAQS